MTHAEVGGRLLARWNFPPNLVAAVAFHHHPGDAGAEHRRLAACVYLANTIAYFLGYGYGFRAFAIRGRAEALTLAGVTPADIPRLMIQTQGSFQVVQSLLQA